MPGVIGPDALSRLRLLVAAARPPLVAGELDRELPPIQPGQPIDGRVEERTQAGYLVSISGRNFEIKLPDGTRTGDLLRMVYVSGDPRPTFALLRVDRPAVQRDSTLSDAGKLLSMLQEIQAETPDGATVTDAKPVFPSQLPEGAEAAALLREALTLSGLFYESHQAQWVLGTRTASQLRREPQASLAPLPVTAPASENAHPRSPVATEPRQPGAQAVQDPAIDEATAGKSAQTEPAPRSLAHPDSYPIIQQQLHALESGHVEWRGMIWPGQSMRWRVSEEAPDSNDPGNRAPDADGATRTWRTELHLELPTLGEISARIELGTGGARLRLAADSEAHALRLREQTSSLAQRFAAAGIRINAIEVGNGRAAA